MVLKTAEASLPRNSRKNDQDISTLVTMDEAVADVSNRKMDLKFQSDDIVSRISRISHSLQASKASWLSLEQDI